MPRKPQIGYYESRKAYYTKVNGEQHKLAFGPDDAPNGPTYLAALDEFKRLMEKGSLDKAGNDNTVRAVLDEYLIFCESAVKGSTLKDKIRFCRLFAGRYGELRISQVKPFHAEQIVAEMRKTRRQDNQRKELKWGNGTARQFLIHMRAAFNWAVKKELITRNPLRGVDLPSSRTSSRERIVEPEEHLAILALLTMPRQQCLRRLIVALEDTGARPGELANARVGDFDPEWGTITYSGDDKRRLDEFRHKTGAKKDRVITFSGQALEMVRNLYRDKQPGDLIFPSNKRKKYGQQVLSQCFAELRDRAGLSHLVMYSYRHTFITRWLMDGGDIDTLAELMGNTPETIRKHYSHLCRQHKHIRSKLEGFKARIKGNGTPS